MNLICSIFLTLFVVFRPLVPLVEYAVHYEYISEVLCINKSNPKLQCNGKCYLKKELAKNSDTDSSPLSKIKNSGQKILDFYILPDHTEIKITGKISLFSFKFTYKTDYSFLFLKQIFRPPIF